MERRRATGAFRALRAIAAGKRAVTASDGQYVRLADDEGHAVRCKTEDIAALARRALIARSGSMLMLTREGEALLRRQAAECDPFQAQHRDLERIEVETPHGYVQANVNLAESPIGQLARRKDRNGRAFLSDGEFRAGEKLRADYTKGQLMPRLGANWDAAVATGRRGAPASDISDIALAARTRVEHAIDAVGPELAGVLVDVCCFLKGLETVEAERGWPVRSAKVVLKAALSALHRHYEPAPATPRSARVLNWGTPGYRPQMGGRERS